MAESRISREKGWMVVQGGCLWNGVLMRRSKAIEWAKYLTKAWKRKYGIEQWERILRPVNVARPAQRKVKRNGK